MPLDLRQHEHDALRQVVRAGRDGASITDVGVTVAIRLSLAGLAKITKGAEQCVVATQQGVAFSRRSVFA